MDAWVPRVDRRGQLTAWGVHVLTLPDTIFWLRAVMVDVDRAVDVARCEGICEVAGVELSSAPRRPINFKTLLKKMDFVAYGENTDTCAAH